MPVNEQEYRARAQRRSPKLVVFLIDESVSMTESGPDGTPKHKLLDRQVNGVLRTIGSLNSSHDEGIVDRMYAAVLGYGGTDRNNPEIISLLRGSTGSFEQSSPWMSISELFNLPAAEVIDGTRQFVVSSPTGWTPMSAAIHRAGTVINDWVTDRLASNGGLDDPRFPLPAPVILNVTDGLPTDDDGKLGPVERWAQLLNEGKCYPDGPSGEPMHLIDGPPLLINVGTPGGEGESAPRQLIFPTSRELPNDKSVGSEGVRRLWRLASPMHPNILATAVRKGLLSAGSTADDRRLYVSAGQDWDLLQKVFEWGTLQMESPR